MALPGGTLGAASLVEIEGAHRLVATGCKGICTYTEDAVCIRVPEGVLGIYGDTLEMGCLSEDGVTVSGCIRRIEFVSEG